MKTKKILSLILASALAFCSISCDKQVSEEKAERKIAVQTFTLRQNTLEEILTMLKGTVKYIELHPGLMLSKQYPDVKITAFLPDDKIEFMKKLLKENDIEIVSFGMTGGNIEKKIKAHFEFCKKLGIKTIVTEETNPKNFPLWQKYAKETGIKMALHNHGSNSPANKYYDPNIVKETIAPYDMIGASPDNGHWARSGIDTVEGYKILNGKIFSLHFKDVDKFNDLSGKAVTLGTGVLDLKAILAQLDAQGYDGYFVIENEPAFKDPMPVVKASVEFLKNN